MPEAQNFLIPPRIIDAIKSIRSGSYIDSKMYGCWIRFSKHGWLQVDLYRKCLIFCLNIFICSFVYIQNKHSSPFKKMKNKTKKTNTRNVRKYDYTPALVLSKHMASSFDEKCREKEKAELNRRKPDLNPTKQQVTVNLYNKFLSHDTHCLCYSVNLIWALYHISLTKI